VIGKKITPKVKAKMIEIIRDRESGMSFKDIATKHWMTKGYVDVLYRRGMMLKKFGRLK